MSKIKSYYHEQIEQMANEREDQPAPDTGEDDCTGKCPECEGCTPWWAELDKDKEAQKKFEASLDDCPF